MIRKIKSNNPENIGFDFNLNAFKFFEFIFKTKMLLNTILLIVNKDWDSRYRGKTEKYHYRKRRSLNVLKSSQFE